MEREVGGGIGMGNTCKPIKKKKSRLMMKFLLSEGHLERYTELHGEEKREEGVRGDQEKRGIQKGKEQASQ